MSNVLKPVVALYAMKVIETNLAWYMSEGMLSTEVGAAVPQQIRSALCNLGSIHCLVMGHDFSLSPMITCSMYGCSVSCM